ncbi:MAG TPA: MASE1 domain-containing protein [Methylomirabilota bacterium]|nr:MASE1 domain-containing protein [Methylomirabilota bacterium]
MTEPRKRLALWQLGLLTLAYFAAGKLGLSLAVVNASVSPVWPPTGIAFASFLVLGPRVWPAILIGAFLVNVTTTGSIAPSLGIAIGNTCEGRLGAELVRLFANGRNVFSRARDVFKFVVLAGLFSTAVSATIGVSSLALAGHAAWRDYPAIWFTWWLGDAVGALVVGPAVVLWSARGDDSRSRARRLEGIGLFATVVAVGALVFFGVVGQPLTFLCLPPLVWTAFRFGRRETAAAIAILSGLAIWGTIHGLGPFADGPPNEALLLLQAFLGTMAVMSIMIAAVVAERKRDEAALAHLASIVEFSDDAIVSGTLEGVVTSWNAGAERLYGYSAAEAVGRPISIIIPPDHPNELLRVLARLKRGEHVQPYETARLRKDSTRVQVSVAISPLRSPSGAVIGASAISRDITEKARADAALREAATLRSVTSLAVAAAHEINNPLTVVSGELQLLAREIGARWSSRVAAMLEALERIREVVLRMNQITRLVPAERQRYLPEMLDLGKSSGRDEPPAQERERAP